MSKLNWYTLSCFIITLTLMAGCIIPPNMKQMRDRFQFSVNSQIGNRLDELTNKEAQVIGFRKPTDVEYLPNGKMLYVYEDYWLQYEIQRTPCTVFLEVDSETEIVTNAYSRGAGCYMPY